MMNKWETYPRSGGRNGLEDAVVVINSHSTTHLESKDLVVELADRAGLLVSESFGRLLHGSNHGGWSTEQDLNVISRGGEMLLWPKLVDASSVC